INYSSVKFLNLSKSIQSSLSTMKSNVYKLYETEPTTKLSYYHNGTTEYSVTATQEANDKPFKCTIPGCVKSYKNPNGLKYHTEHGHRSALSDTEVEKKPAIKPYRCNFPECEKRYKNPNGLKYHVEHAHHSIIRRG
ncbi:109_t:CDS:2, partial [Dentiscutata heterogama]